MTSGPWKLAPTCWFITSEALDRPLEVTGPIRVTLWAASSAVDTDFTAKLVDVHPDGYAQNLLDGIIRARYRDSRSSPVADHTGRAHLLHHRPLGYERRLLA